MPDRATASAAGPLLVLAPTGRDGEAAAAMLGRRGVDCRVLPDLAALHAAVGEDATGAVLVADEALAGPALDALSRVLAAQPPWSDLPFVVLTRGGAARGAPVPEDRLFAALGNAVLLERPLSAPTLTGAVRSALRARVRQRELRAHLAERGANAAALRESEERLRLIVESAKDHAIITTDPDGGLTGWSHGAEAIFGWTAAEVVGGPAPLFFTPEDRAAGVPELEFATARDKGCANDERWHLRKDGGRVFMNGSVHPLRDASGSLRGFIKIARDETERRQAESALRRSRDETGRQRRLYEAILTNTPDLAYVFDRDHRFIYANDVLLRMWGRTWEEAIGKNCLELGYEPWHAAMHDREIEQVIANREPIRGEVPFTGTFGRRIYDYIFVPVLGADGEVEAIAGTTRDVTEHKRKEDALRESEERFRSIAKATSDAVWDWDMRTNAVWWNEGITAIFGHPRGSVGPDATWWYDNIHPDDRQRVLDDIHGVIGRAEQQWEHEYRYRRGDGGYLDVFDRGYTIQDAAGTTIRMVGGMQDITERKRAEAALRESETRYRTLFNSIDAGFCTIEVLFDGMGHPTDYRFIEVNPAFERQTGIERAAGRRMREIAPAHEQHWFDTYGRVARTGEPVRLENRAAALDGRWFEVYAFRVGEPDARRVAVLFNDISERRRGEEALARHRDELERLVEERTAALLREAEERRRAEEIARQGEKLRAIGQLTGGIAHDFNNILQVVSSGAQLLKSPRLREERRAAVLDGMVQAAQNAKELTGRLLAFARKQPLKPETFDLNARLLGMAELLRGTLGGRVRVETDLAPDLWPVRIDPQQLEIAVLNLAVNARDAMPDAGGTLTLQTRNAWLEASGDRAAGECVRLSVTDTGRGMPPAVLARVFEPFFTTKAHCEGTGLGLAQVHGFAKQSGGDVAAESAPGEGTSIVLHLPRAAAAAAAEADAAEPGAPAEMGQLMQRAAGRSVLVVEDNADVADFACTMLEGLGYATRRAGSAAEALHALAAAGEPIDAVFSDVVMPGGMSGLDLAATLRRRYPGLAVVLATGYSDAVAAWRGELPAEVLSKPYRLEELAAALERALARSAGAAPVAVAAAV